MDIPRLYKYRYFNENMVSRNGLPNGEQIPQWHQVLYDGLIFPASPDTFKDYAKFYEGLNSLIWNKLKVILAEHSV